MAFKEKVLSRYHLVHADSKIDPDFFLSVEDYTQPMPHQTMNDIDLLVAQAKNLPKEVRKKYTDYPYEVYRGTFISSDNLKNLKAGKYIELKPTSWSKDEDEAEKFAQGYAGREEHLVLISFTPTRSQIIIDLDAMASDRMFEDYPDIDVGRITNEAEVILDKVKISLGNIRLVNPIYYEEQGTVSAKYNFSGKDTNNIYDWVFNYEKLSPEKRTQLREELPKLDSNRRLISKLSRETRHKTIGGQIHFLLFRGTKEDEYSAAKHGENISYKHRTSWSPDPYKAIHITRTFSAKQGLSEIVKEFKLNKSKHLLAAWIPIEALLLAPFLANDPTKPGDMKAEWEVIVAPGTFKAANYQDAKRQLENTFKMTPEEINRGKREELREANQAKRQLSSPWAKSLEDKV